MEDKKTILMIANSDTGANGFLSFVERLKDRNDIRFVMVCHPRVQSRAVKEKSRNLGNASFKVLDFDKRERQRGKALVNRDYKYVKDRFYVSAYKAAFNTVKIVTQNRQGLRRAKIMMKNEKPDAVLLYADNKSELEKFFIYCAKRQRIPTIVAPICMSDIEGILLNPSNGFRQKKTDKLPITARIVKRINPRLEREYGDQVVFFSQPFREILERLMGFGVPNPWVQGSLADIVCTAYQEQYDETVKELGEESAKGRLFLTESVEDGIIIEGYENRESVRNALAQKYGLQQKETVVIAFSERVQQCSKENDLYNKGVIVRSVLESFDEVLVSLHPKSDPDENRFLEDFKGCHIVEEPLRQIIGAADLIVYADISSIFRWVDWLHISKVTFRSYSMQEKWTDDMIAEFQAKVEDAKKAGTVKRAYEPERGIDFAKFVLDRI